MRMEPCPRMAAKVARSTPASAIRIAKVCLKNESPALVHTASWALLSRPIWWPGLREAGKIQEESPVVLHASISRLSGAGPKVRRAAVDFPERICNCPRSWFTSNLLRQAPLRAASPGSTSAAPGRGHISCFSASNKTSSVIRLHSGRGGFKC